MKTNKQQRAPAILILQHRHKRSQSKGPGIKRSQMADDGWTLSLSLPLYCEFHIDSGSYACLGSSSKLGASAKLGGSQNRSRASRPLLLRIRLFALGSLSRSLSPLSLFLYICESGGLPSSSKHRPVCFYIWKKKRAERKEGRVCGLWTREKRWWERSSKSFRTNKLCCAWCSPLSSPVPIDRYAYVDEYATEKIGNWTLFSSPMYFFGWNCLVRKQEKGIWDA